MYAIYNVYNENSIPQLDGGADPETEEELLLYLNHEAFINGVEGRQLYLKIHKDIGNNLNELLIQL